jgi:hypothetical protein
MLRVGRNGRAVVGRARGIGGRDLVERLQQPDVSTIENEGAAGGRRTLDDLGEEAGKN